MLMDGIIREIEMKTKYEWEGRDISGGVRIVVDNDVYTIICTNNNDCRGIVFALLSRKMWIHSGWMTSIEMAEYLTKNSCGPYDSQND